MTDHPAATAGAVPRTCYVVMCHTDPDGVLQLARRLRELSPECAVLLRHDRGPGYLSAAEAAAAGAELLDSSTTAAWGDWSLTRAVLEALDRALQTGAGRIVLLSGQDHPVRPLSQWEAELDAAGSDARFHHVPPHESDHRYRWRRWTPPQRVPLLLRRCAAAAWRLSSPLLGRWVLGHPLRGTPDWSLGVRRRASDTAPLPLVKGSAWMALSRRAVEAVLERDASDTATREFFSTTRISDESYVQTLLHTVPGLVVEDLPTAHARFPDGGWSPVWLSPAEVAVLRTSPAAFARKVAPGDPSGFRRAADALVAERAGSAASGG